MNDLLKFITCGSVDDGKSTLIGHILYDSKLLYTDQEQALLLDSQVGSCGGAIDYSLLLDGLVAEREQGITIDVAYRYFTTKARSFIVADTPGHEEYTRNMAVGASFADLAIILLDASKGVLVQTRRHARICGLMGIRHFVFAVNKMDLVNYEQEPFAAIVEEIEALRAELSLENTVVIPLCATQGDNVTQPSLHMPWYHGPTLLHHLETVDLCQKAQESGFYLPVQRVCRPDHSFRGFQGQIEAGCIHVGDQLTTIPSQEKAVVQRIFVGDQPVAEAFAGQPVTIQLDREVDVSRGCVLAKDANLKVGKSFGASLLWMDDAILAPGKEYWVKIGTKLLPAVISTIRHKVDINNGKKMEAYTLVKNEIAFCDITLLQPTVLDLFQLHKTLGELILIDRVSHATAACGVIQQIYAKSENGTILSDGDAQALVDLFDVFYYHPSTHTIIRHNADRQVYHLGDKLPLSAAGYHYPENFDIKTDILTCRVRNGRFVGFGPREDSHPLLNRYGFGLEGTDLQPFETYHTVVLWRENTYEI